MMHDRSVTIRLVYRSLLVGTITDVRERDRLEASRERKRMRRYQRARLLHNVPILATYGTVVALVTWVAATR